MTTNQISNLKEYLRYAILQEAIEQIEEDDYDSVELNEENWFTRLLGPTGKPIGPETTSNKVLGPDGNVAKGSPGGILGPDGNPVRPNKPNTSEVAKQVAKDGINKSAENQGVRRGNRKPLTPDELRGVLAGINKSMRFLVQDGELVDGWQKMKETSELAGHISHFTTSTHDGLRNNGINPDAVMFTLHHEFDRKGHLTTILNHLRNRTHVESTTVGRDIRYFIRTFEGTRGTVDKPGQPGIPHPHRVNRLHKYGINDPSELTAEHTGHHNGQVRAFLEKHGEDVRNYIGLTRG